MRKFLFFGGVGVFAVALACGGEPLNEARDVRGNFELTYEDNLRIYVNDELLIDVVSGEDPDITFNGEVFKATAVCGDVDTVCPSEAFWRELAIDQPDGTSSRLVNFVNLDGDRGTLGQRMGGLMDDAGALAMLAGLDLDGNENCVGIGVASVVGKVSADNTSVDDGIVRVEWAAGCTFDGVEIGGKLRIETDFVADRVGNFDLGSVTPEEPIDEDGTEI